MQELKIGMNEENQRIDRFIAKYLDLAPKSFINKMIRKKNIEVNRKKVESNYILKNGDMVQLFLADDTIDKFQSIKMVKNSDLDLDIVYEDENILIVHKPEGLLVHSSGIETEENLVDAVIFYLSKKDEYNIDDELTFKPSACNRLDKNTSGLVIVGKTYETLKQTNKLMSERTIKRFYKTIVYGKVNGDITLKDNVIKDSKNNKMHITSDEDSLGMETNIRVIKALKEYSLLEIELITGRTHQIRLHLNSIKHPIVGERKYTLDNIDRGIEKKYNIDYQLLNGYKIILDGYTGNLEYLNGKEVISNMNKKLEIIENDIFYK